ncbi:peptidoglycan D,D-transpeptidase FtsI family protein [Gordonia shandongensis]|uniref:peptidoglycan D,D-transpeptidase FtsI family protein n=1 Tax=Gordonia shandongensis TaxID=376351 RepID=UPI0004076988|nr:penicillin-binding protein 2 [Gordonia shandongensis]
MNRPIQRVAVVAIILVVALLANSTYVQVFRADSLRNDVHNKRTRLEENQRLRGTIVTRDGTVVLARSVPNDDKTYKYRRVYLDGRDGRMYAPVTGFYSPFMEGRGLEYSENSVLSGSDDALFTQRFMDMFAGRDPRGGTVVTTIDPKVQQTAYNALTGADCDGPCRGAVVAMEPSTGKILGMASTPMYDPSKLAVLDQTAFWNTWDEYDPKAIAGPLKNKALATLAPPGSTFKVVTTAAAIADGVSPDTRLTSQATLPLPGTSISNDSRQTCPEASGGQVTLTQAFEYSCNTAFVELINEKMGGDGGEKLTSMAEKFGFDEELGIPINVSPSQVHDPGTDPATLGKAAIGQEVVSLTVLQNAMIASTIANGGVRMKPYLVDKIQTADLKTVSTTSPSPAGHPLSSEQASVISDMMVRSEQHTAGAQAGIASKTGTADHAVGASEGTPYAWYIAFAPASSPEIAVAVVVENSAKGAGAYGGVVAAPIARKVMNAYTGGPR